MKNLYLTMAAVLFSTVSFAQSPRSANTPTQLKNVWGETESTKGENLYVPTNDNRSWSLIHRTKAISVPSETTIINEQPEGTVHEKLYRNSCGFFNASGVAYKRETEGYVAKYVEGKDGAFYIANPVSTVSTGWLKGYKTSGDTIKFKLPQPVFSQQYVDKDGNVTDSIAYTYAWRMNVSEVKDEKGKTHQTYVPDASQDLIYVLSNDTLTKVDNALLGLGNKTGLWNGFGEISHQEFVNKDQVVAAPAKADEASDYTLQYVDLVQYYNDSTTTVVKGIADEKNIYLKGLNYLTPNAWVKGEIKGNKAVFKKQYLGLDVYGRYHAYFIPTYIHMVYNFLVGYSLPKIEHEVDSVVFDYDAATKTLKTDSAFMLNIGKTHPEDDGRYLTAYFQAKTAPYAEVSTTPQDPVVKNYASWPYDINYGKEYIKYIMSDRGTNDEILNPKKLYYNIYINGQLKAFDPSEFNFFEKPETDIPYEYTDKHMFDVHGKEHNVYFWDGEIHTIGVQLVYTGGGTTTKSNLITFDVDAYSSIKTVSSNDDALNSKALYYHDLSGREVKNPASGIYLKTVKLADGTLKTIKVLLK